MTIYALGRLEPRIAPSAYVHPDAVVIGDVTIGPDSTVWPQTVIRGDYGTIVVGSSTSIQDGTVIHAAADVPTSVGDRCVIGHVVHLESCLIGDDSLVGSGAIVLNNAVVEDGAQIAAGAVVTGTTRVPAGALAIGVPARIIPGRADAAFIAGAVATYMANGRRYRSDLRRID